MSASLKLPPTDRDFEIYDAIHIAGLSTRCQADLHHISQTRVRQIVRRVVEWLGEVLPPQTKVAKEQETHLARQIAADRFQRQLEQATTFWDMTQDVKYAGIRIRLTTAQARLGVVGGLIDGLAADAIEGLPVPVWTPAWESEASAEPSAVGRGSPDPAQIDDPKSLFPPPGYTPKLRHGPCWDEIPRELWDPLRWEEITPEIVAARAAWGRPFSPVLIQNLQKCGILPSDDLPSADTAASQSAICNLQSEIHPPPPFEDCSPSSEDGAIASAESSIENPVTPSTCDKNITDQIAAATGSSSASQPLLTNHDPLPITEVRLTPDQPGATISQMAPSDSRLPIPDSLPCQNNSSMTAP